MNNNDIRIDFEEKFTIFKMFIYNAETNKYDFGEQTFISNETSEMKKAINREYVFFTEGFKAGYKAKHYQLSKK